MEFNPNNPVIKRCLQGMAMEEKENLEEASRLFLQAWKEATDDFETFIAAYFVARRQKSIPDKLKWLQASLHAALNVNNDNVKGAFPSLYAAIAKCYEDMGDTVNAKKSIELSVSYSGKITDKGLHYICESIRGLGYLRSISISFGR